MIKVPYPWAIRSLQLINLLHDSKLVTVANHAVQGPTKVSIG